MNAISTHIEQTTRTSSSASRSLVVAALLLCGLPLQAAPLPVPEILHYRFDETGTTVTNQASAPPAGTATGTITGTTMSQGLLFTPVAGKLVGTGASSTSDYVNTGWVTSLPGSWTISFFTGNVQPSATLYYIFGDINAGSFRCFTNGVAGPNNWILRGTGMTDVTVSGAAVAAPHMTTFVYDQTLANIKGYLDGVLVTTVAQGTPVISGTGPFKVAGYSTNVGLNGDMADFRIYSHALTDAEIADIYTFITTDTPLTVETSHTDVTCNGGADGTATVTPTGGLPPFTYAWSPIGGNAAVATDLIAGDYTVSVTDNFGLTALGNATVAEPTAIVFTTTTLTDAPVLAPYSVSISASGGTGTITYAVTGGALPDGITLAADGTLSGTPTVLGNYSFTVSATDANTCLVPADFTLAVVVNPDIIFIDGFDQAAPVRSAH
jgi:hypothetical protein